jgi:hypothetical protein
MKEAFQRIPSILTMQHWVLLLLLKENESRITISDAKGTTVCLLTC